jgi:phospholipid-transporting ATPase
MKPAYFFFQRSGSITPAMTIFLTCDRSPFCHLLAQEVLGAVEHILSDKTGTLTQNIMTFAACSVGNTLYDVRENSKNFSHAVRASSNSTPSPAHRLALAMALTHSVVPEKVVDEETEAITIEYHAASPDEVALVAAARDYGFELLENKKDKLILRAFDSPDSVVVYDSLAELEFSSDRKRMSAIVRDVATGRIYLYTKGADAVMLDLLKPSSGPVGSHTNYRSKLDDHIQTMAVKGLRTLVYGVRELTTSEYEQWSVQWKVASNLLEGRSKRQAELSALLEVDLDYIGTTAVEDKLQDRCPETIEFLRAAGVRIWVLTGDKLETAENIGYSANLLNRAMRVEPISVVSPDDMRARLHAIIEIAKDDSTKLSVIIDGASLMALEGDSELEQLFMDATDTCLTVICARVTPGQKARVVSMSRRWRKAITLAIGDGGNDVSMIQEAHVGVGIVGKEGTQASLAADYSIAEFRHLQRLMTVHGRYSYIRSAGVINLSLYKNLTFAVTQICFQFFAFATVVTFHQQWVATAFNAFLTPLGPLL